MSYEAGPIPHDMVLGICERSGLARVLADRHDIDTETFAAIIERNVPNMPGRSGLQEDALAETARCAVAVALKIDLLMKGFISSPLLDACEYIRLDAVRV